MTRRDFAALPAAVAAAADRPARPNVVLITLDHLRTDNIGANGNPAIQTPHLDRFAGQGVNFTNCQTAGVACAPNRASLFTGRYPSSHRVIRNGQVLPEGEITLAHALREQGYHCAQKGKLHFRPHEGRDHRATHPSYGFHELTVSETNGLYEDAYADWLYKFGKDLRLRVRPKEVDARAHFEYYPFPAEERFLHAAWVADIAVDFLRESRRQRPQTPFFLHVGFHDPHPPVNPPQAKIDLYKGVELPPRHAKKGEADALPPVMAKAVREHENTPSGIWDEYRRFFYAKVTSADEHVGRLLRCVDERGISGSTLIVITSDHGDYLGDHNLINKSEMPYHGAMQTPLLFRGPGLPSGKTHEGLCQLVDVMPTILELCGIPFPKGVQGMSLKPGQAIARARPEACVESRTNRILRTRDAKYAIWRDGQEVLFDLRSDPNEFSNRANDPSAKELLAEMRRLLLQWSLEMQDPLPMPVARF